MNIEQEARTISTSIIDWCFRDEVRMDVDENYPTHIVESLLKRQKKECIEKACEWLLMHTTIPYETENGEPIVYSVIDTAIKRKEIVDEFRNAMEEG